MIIQLDNREKSLIPLIETIFTNNESIYVQVVTLDIGDIIIKTDEGIDLLVIERKSLNDLASSIKDGRYVEQSLRLDSLELPNHNIIYLLEGNLITFKNKYKINKETLLSSIVSLQYFKGFSVIRTMSVMETAEYISRCAIQLEKKIIHEHKQAYYIESNNTNIDTNNNLSLPAYTSVIKKQKKANITPENIDIIFLSQIPMISDISARAILDKYKTILDLVACVKENTDCLDTITYETKGKTRKISKKVIENIKLYLCK